MNSVPWSTNALPRSPAGGSLHAGHKPAQPVSIYRHNCVGGIVALSAVHIGELVIGDWRQTEQSA